MFRPGPRRNQDEAGSANTARRVCCRTASAPAIGEWERIGSIPLPPMTPLPHLAAARVRRELAHLQALAARNRVRAAWARLTRGTLGFLGGFAALAAVPAAPFAAKLFAAALIGLALVWPFAALVVLAIVLLVLSLFSNST